MLLNNRGFTLVEVIIALTILLIVFLALMQTSLVGIDANMKNVLRDEAIRIAEQRMNEAWTTNFADVDDDTNAFPGGSACPALLGEANGVEVQRNIRNVANFLYCTHLEMTTIGTDKKEITVNVMWEWRNNEERATLTSIRRDM